MTDLPVGHVFTVSGTYHDWPDVGELLLIHEPLEREAEGAVGDCNVRFDCEVEDVINDFMTGSTSSGDSNRSYMPDMLGRAPQANKVGFRIMVQVEPDDDIKALAYEVWAAGKKPGADCHGSVKHVAEEIRGYFGDVPGSIRPLTDYQTANRGKPKDADASAAKPWYEWD